MASEQVHAQLALVQLVPLGHEVNVVLARTCPCQPQEVEEDQVKQRKSCKGLKHLNKCVNSPSVMLPNVSNGSDTQSHSL